MTAGGDVAARTWARDGITVTCRDDVDAGVVAELWPVYEAAFGALRTRAAARQVLTREEFDAELIDDRVSKYVARRGDRVVGLTTLTRDLSTVPWISPEYFAHRYPEATARDAVFYLGFTLVDPTEHRSRVLDVMLRAVVELFVAHRAVVGYDVCGWNDTVLRFGDGLSRFLHRVADVVVAPCDVQTYYAAEFSGADAGPRSTGAEGGA